MEIERKPFLEKRTGAAAKFVCIAPGDWQMTLVSVPDGAGQPLDAEIIRDGLTRQSVEGRCAIWMDVGHGPCDVWAMVEDRKGWAHKYKIDVRGAKTTSVSG